MSVRGVPAPTHYQPLAYWEDRARRFATSGSGLAAVCSYGMPEFYNRMIHDCQRRALQPWLNVTAGTRVLDIGCGVGRWSTLLAARGAQVTGVDLSPTMIAQAQRRAAQHRLGERCRFLVQDLAQLDVDGAFDLVLGVTVLQHILDTAALQTAVQRLAAHLAPGGRMVLLEAAPVRRATHCNTSVFEARPRDAYLQVFAQHGLRVHSLSGVDPVPLKTWVLPRLRRWPRPAAWGAIAAVTLASWPIDLSFGRWASARSWHAVFVLQREACAS